MQSSSPLPHVGGVAVGWGSTVPRVASGGGAAVGRGSGAG